MKIEELDEPARGPENLHRVLAKNGLAGWPQSPANDPADTTATPKIAVPHSGDSTSRYSAEFIGKYRRFVPVALAFASMSKMPGTKVGCLILGSAFQVLSSGWNGAARRSKADVDGRLADRATRLTWVVHAEANAIANAARSGTALDGGTLICTLMPCMACAKSIVQAGIMRVLCPRPTDIRWSSEFETARALFKECFVDLVYYDSDTIGDCE